MKLINNQSLDAPEEYYVFVNMNNAITKNNIEKTQCICSGAFFQYIEKADKTFADKYLKGSITAYSLSQKGVDNFTEKFLNGELDYLPFNYNQNCDVNFVSMFTNSISSLYTIEYNCEISRRYFYQNNPSRLSSCYAFADYESCIKVNNLYGWNLNNVRKFKLLNHEANKVSKVNMEIISLARSANDISYSHEDTQKQLWKSYWEGFGSISMELPTINGGRQIIESGCLWEYLVEGILMLVE